MKHICDQYWILVAFVVTESELTRCCLTAYHCDPEKSRKHWLLKETASCQYLLHHLEQKKFNFTAINSS